MPSYLAHLKLYCITLLDVFLNPRNGQLLLYLPCCGFTMLLRMVSSLAFGWNFLPHFLSPTMGRRCVSVEDPVSNSSSLPQATAVAAASDWEGDATVLCCRFIEWGMPLERWTASKLVEFLFEIFLFYFQKAPVVLSVNVSVCVCVSFVRHGLQSSEHKER